MAYITSKPGYGIAGSAFDLGFLLRLAVPGLAEKRPSVIIGEYLFLLYEVRYVTYNN